MQPQPWRGAVKELDAGGFELRLRLFSQKR
jgi:hypothetical protein